MKALAGAALMLVSGALLGACAERSSSMPPLTDVSRSPPAKQVYVIVQHGQSLDQIARTFRVPRADIIAANNLAPPYSVRPGAALAIPGAAPYLADESIPAPKIARPVRTAAKSARADVVQSASEPAKSKLAAPRAKPSASEVIPLD